MKKDTSFYHLCSTNISLFHIKLLLRRGLLHAVLAFVIIANMPFSEANNKLNLDDYFVVGESNYRFLIWNVYGATLQADSRDYNSPQEIISWRDKKNISLTLDYNINASAGDIVEKTVEEIQELGFDNAEKLSDWQVQMNAIFPDISKKDKLTAMFRQSGKSVFYKNGEYIGDIADAEFGLWFFSIWLDETASRDRDFSLELLGMKS